MRKTAFEHSFGSDNFIAGVGIGFYAQTRKRVEDCQCWYIPKENMGSG